MTDLKEQSCSSPPPGVQVSNVALSVSNPRLTETDPAFIFTFLNEYDKYCQNVIASEKQLQSGSEGSSTTTTEAVLYMQLKYCVDAQHFKS